MEQGQSNWVGYHISVNSASARKTKEGRSSKCLGLEGGSSTKFCTQQLPWRLLSYFGLYCFVSASFFGDNVTLDDLTSDCYSFWNCPGGLSYDCFAPPQHNLKEHHKYFHKIHFCVIPISINQSIIIAWSIPFCHFLNVLNIVLLMLSAKLRLALARSRHVSDFSRRTNALAARFDFQTMKTAMIVMLRVMMMIMTTKWSRFKTSLCASASTINWTLLSLVLATMLAGFHYLQTLWQSDHLYFDDQTYIWVILRCWGKSSLVCQQKSDAL